MKSVPKCINKLVLSLAISLKFSKCKILATIQQPKHAWAPAEVFVKLFPHNEKKGPAPKKVNVKNALPHCYNEK